jgi:hypothetical protein
MTSARRWNLLALARGARPHASPHLVRTVRKYTITCCDLLQLISKECPTHFQFVVVLWKIQVSSQLDLGDPHRQTEVGRTFNSSDFVEQLV